MIIRAPRAVDNFSYRIVQSGVIRLIPLEQQMLSYQEIEIQDTGELEIEGEVVIIE